MRAPQRTVAWLLPAAIFAVAAVVSLQAASAFQDKAQAETDRCRAAGNTGLECLWSGYEHKLAGEALFWIGFCAGGASLGMPFLARWYGKRAIRRASAPSGTR